MVLNSEEEKNKYKKMMKRKNTKWGLLLAIFFLVACNNAEDIVKWESS